MAIQKSHRIPALNPLRFIPVNWSRGTGINTYPFDKGFAHQQIRTFHEDMRFYHQKVAGSDKISIYVDSLAGGIRFYIVDTKGVVVHTLGSPSTPFVVPTNLDPDFGLPYTTYGYSFYGTDVSLADGEYHILIEHLYGGGWGDAENKYHISERIDYCEDGHEDTMLIQYSHNFNEFDVLFRSPLVEAGCKPFFFRAEMILDKPEHGSSDTVWEDQLNIIQQEQSIPFNTYPLIVGGGGGVPVWVTDKINRILSCNEVYIDNIRMRKNTGASWSYERVKGWPLHVGSITLREIDLSRNYVDSNLAESDADRRYVSGYSDAYV